MKVPDLAGQKFGRLTVIRRAGSRGGHSAWECVCDCSTVKVVTAGNLKSGITVSCGCVRKRHVMAAVTKHGMAHRSEYKIWTGMKLRCTSPENKDYPQYGARGIRVCPAWIDSFEDFYAHVGPRPSSDHSLDRIDNDGNYEPGNVRWATRSEQARNRRERARNLDGTWTGAAA